MHRQSQARSEFNPQPGQNNANFRSDSREKSSDSGRSEGGTVIISEFSVLQRILTNPAAGETTGWPWLPWGAWACPVCTRRRGARAPQRPDGLPWGRRVGVGAAAQAAWGQRGLWQSCVQWTAQLAREWAAQPGVCVCVCAFACVGVCSFSYRLSLGSTSVTPVTTSGKVVVPAIRPFGHTASYAVV